MSMSDRERRLLAELARQLEEQDPDLASALRGSPRPAAARPPGPRRRLVRWHERFAESERAPMRAAVAGGVLFVGSLFLAGNLTAGPAPHPGARTEAPVFAEQDLLPASAAPSMFRIGP